MVRPSYSATALLTDDQQYLLFTPGNECSLNIKCLKMEEALGDNVKLPILMNGTELTVPKQGSTEKSHTYFLTKNWNQRVIIDGYIRKVCKKCRMEMLTVNLMDMVMLFCGSDQFLHCIQDKFNKGESKKIHWILPVSELLRRNTYFR